MVTKESLAEEMKDIFKKGERATIIAGFTTLFFALTKGIVGFFSGSVVLIADAIHSSADAFSTFAAWFGLRIAQKKPTGKFPYGFYKAENVAAFLISGLILFAGYEIIKESIGKLFTEYELNIPLVAISVAVLDAIVMFLIGRYEMKIGKEINSQSLTADGRESKMHIFSSSIVLAGLVSAWIGIPYLEGAMGILISLFIFKIGLESARDSIFALMDVSPSKEVEQKVREILGNIAGVYSIENLRLRKSGPFIFGEVQANVRKNLDVKRAREISENIEKEVKRKIETIDSLNVYFKPIEIEKGKVAIPIEDGNDIYSKISENFARAQKFIFLELNKGIIENYYLKENPYKEKKIRAGLDVCNFMAEEKVDFLIVKEIGPISLHTLRDNMIDVYQGSDLDVKSLIESFSKKELEVLKEPTREKT